MLALFGKRLIMWNWLFGTNTAGIEEPILQMGRNRDPQWNEVRKEFIESKGNDFCFVCTTKDNLDVHHIIPVHVCSRLELEPTNLITLCRPHHFLFGHLLCWSCYNPAVLKDAKQWRDKIARRE